MLSCLLYPVLGRDFFPSVDAGQIRLHFRAPTGTRIEETARIADAVEAAIRELIPKDQLETILDNLGVPNSGINLSYSNAGTIGTLDGEILMSLQEGPPARPNEFVSLLRAELPKRFPGIEFFFQPADIVTQILNFGLPAAIDVQFAGAEHGGERGARRRAREVDPARFPARSTRTCTSGSTARPSTCRWTARGCSRSALPRSTSGRTCWSRSSGSSQTAPAFWLNPQNGVVYNIAVQTPQYRVDSLDALLNMPVAAPAAARRRPRHRTQLLGNLVEATPSRQLAVVSRYNIMPAIDVYVSVQGTDLASVADAGAEAGRRDPPEAAARQPGRDARPGRDDAVLVHRPGRRPRDGDRAGLPADRRQLPVVDRRRDHHRRAARRARGHRLDAVHHRHDAERAGADRRDHDDGRRDREQHPARLVRATSASRRASPPLSAALDAGATRIRPVLMTALAMIIGMIPMALGIGEGAEQNAPLGRAVIGGLLFATVSTLFFVPVVFADVHQRLARRRGAQAATRRPRTDRTARSPGDLIA